MTLPLALIPVPRQHFVDTDGAPVALGYLNFYEAGTTTPQAVYADADGSTSLGVSVDLDAGGNAPAIYLQPNGYKVRLYRADDTQVWEQDDVEDVGSAFLSILGINLSEGSRGVDSGYIVTEDDNLVTVDATSDPAIINLPAAADRGEPLTIKNVGATAVRVTPNGSDTIDTVAAYYALPAASSPAMPTITMVSDGVSGYLITGSHAL